MTTTDRLRDALKWIRDELPLRDQDGHFEPPVAHVRRLKQYAIEALAATRSDERWRYVPLEPTGGMIADGSRAAQIVHKQLNTGDVYRAMLAAAPSPPDRDAPPHPGTE